MTYSVFKGVCAPEVGTIYHVLCEKFPLKTIETKSQNAEALKVVERLIDFLNDDASKGARVTKDVEAYLAVLTDLSEQFERKHARQVPKSSPGEILSYLMESHGLKQANLAEDLGGQSVVSDILNGKRDLNVKQVRALAHRFKVSPELFL